MRVLVTGGAGYVGTRLANALTRAGHSVRVLDALLYGNGSCGLRSEVELRRGDICVRSDTARALSGIEVVFHLASAANDPIGSPGVDRARLVNIEGTRILLEEAQRRRVRRFVFASSTSVLGLSAQALNNSLAKPGSVMSYPQSKYLAEQLVVEASGSEFETVVLRQAAICGPSPRQRFDVGVNALVGRAYFDGTITADSGDQRTCHLTMSDAIRLYMSMLDFRGDLIAGEVFDAGWEAQTSLEMALKIREWVPTPSEILPVVRVQKQRSIAGTIEVDSGKVERVLGMRPQYSVGDMVGQLVQLMETGFLDRYDRDIYQNVRDRKSASKPSGRTRGFSLLQRSSSSVSPRS